MDIATDIAAVEHPQPALSYDDDVPYEEQLPTEAEINAASLANRIGSNKVYLLSDAPRPGKRKHTDEEENADIDEMETDQDPDLRANAILLQGPPISHLPTGRLFDYAVHFDVHPLGMEWVDDTTCIFVFSSKAEARSAFLALRKPSDEPSSLDMIELTAARSIPVSLWPPEDRVRHGLGVGQGLRGTISIRWARVDDKKKRGAKRDSEFYKKHGLDAGKETAGFGVVPASVVAAAAAAESQGSLARRIGATLEERITADDGLENSETSVVREWDRGKHGVGPSKKRTGDDIDEFLGEDLGNEDMPVEDTRTSEPRSKMRSDYIADDGRTVIGSMNGKTAGLKDRIMAPLPRRARGGRNRREEDGEENGAPLWVNEDSGRRQRSGRGRGRGRNRELGNSPPRKKTRQELDDELDAFLNKA